MSWWAPIGWSTKGDQGWGPPEKVGPKISRFFSSHAPIFALFVSLRVSPREILVHDSPRAQTCTFGGPGLQKNNQNSTRRHPEGERNGCGKVKKSEILGGPVEECPAEGCKAEGSGGGLSGAGEVWWRGGPKCPNQPHQHQPQP